MEIQIITKQAFSVIGKEGQGPAAEGPQWIPTLWQAANAHFAEIVPLVKLHETTKAPLIWGAMSDVGGTFKPWDVQGKYLAGCEAMDGADAPAGWTKWTIPGFTYVAAECTQSGYGETFWYVLKEYFPENGYTLAGAVHEFYPQPGNTDLLVLYFPIERVE